jgi:AraC-like DNA-binding protein
VASRGAEPDPLVVAAAARLSVVSARVAAVASELGVSERHLNRRTIQAVGYGPKLLARVARLRRLVELDDPRLATRAYAAGYSSQSHMTEEVRRLTGSSPVRFLRAATVTAA